MSIRSGNRRQPGSRLARNVLLAAAAASGLALGYHLISTPEVMAPLHASAVPATSASVLDVLWYDMAILAAIGGIGMAVAAFRVEWRTPLAWFIGGHYIALSLLCLGIGLAWFGHPWELAQWAIFAPLAGVTVWAARSAPGPGMA